MLKFISYNTNIYKVSSSKTMNLIYELSFKKDFDSLNLLFEVSDDIQQL